MFDTNRCFYLTRNTLFMPWLLLFLIVMNNNFINHIYSLSSTLTLSENNKPEQIFRQQLPLSCSEDEYRKECHCGSIAQPPSMSLFTKIPQNKLNSTSLTSNWIVEPYNEEIPYDYKNLRVYYKCTDDRDVLVGNKMRKCFEGNWLGLVPRCGNYLFIN